MPVWNSPGAVVALLCAVASLVLVLVLLFGSGLGVGTPALVLAFALIGVVALTRVI